MVSILKVKKGARVQLKNGWFATVADNKVKSHTRLCTVFGDVTEMGSVYATDIRIVARPDGSWANVEFTPGQLKAAEMRKVLGF